MTGVGHDPWRSHVPGDPVRTSLRDEEVWTWSIPLSPDAADQWTSDELAAWCVDNPGGTTHVLAALDALAGV